jgi:hypothetical protein
LISYATQPGNVALDGTDGNSPYTKSLSATMRRPGLDVFQTFNEVGLAVKRATGGRQQPWVSSSPIEGSFYFVAPDAGITTVALPKAPAPPKFSQPQSLSPFSPEQAGGLFSEQDMERVRAIATRNQLLVMPAFKIERPAPGVPAELRRFIGVWASNVGFDSGRARHAMLIVTKIEASGEVTGYWVGGSPTAQEAFRASAAAYRINGKVTGNQLRFPPEEGGHQDSITATLNRSSDLSVVHERPTGQVGNIALKPVWQLIDAEKSSAAAPKSTVEPVQSQSSVLSSAAPQAAQPSVAESLLWDSIKESHRSLDFNTYLQKFPNGLFAELARSRLAKMAFDGIWSVRQVCSEAADGAKGFTKSYSFSVAEGALEGWFGAPNTINSERLSGEINSDGTAYLQVAGLSGDPGHTFGRPKPGSPYRWPARATFTAQQGTGTRTEGRPCQLTFTRVQAPDAGITTVALPKAPAPLDSSEAQSVVPSSTEQAVGLFSEQDMERVRAIATRNQLLVMPSFKIERPGPEVPSEFRRFIGVWASNVGFGGGQDRQAMLIVTKVEPPEEVTGYWVWGSPTTHELTNQNPGANRNPAGADRINGKVKGNELTFPPEEWHGYRFTATLNRSGDFSIAFLRPGAKGGYIILEPVWRLLSAEKPAAALPKNPVQEPLAASSKTRRPIGPH